MPAARYASRPPSLNRARRNSRGWGGPAPWMASAVVLPPRAAGRRGSPEPVRPAAAFRGVCLFSSTRCATVGWMSAAGRLDLSFDQPARIGCRVVVSSKAAVRIGAQHRHRIRSVLGRRDAVPVRRPAACGRCQIGFDPRLGAAEEPQVRQQSPEAVFSIAIERRIRPGDPQRIIPPDAHKSVEDQRTVLRSFLLPGQFRNGRVGELHFALADQIARGRGKIVCRGQRERVRSRCGTSGRSSRPARTTYRPTGPAASESVEPRSAARRPRRYCSAMSRVRTCTRFIGAGQACPLRVIEVFGPRPSGTGAGVSGGFGDPASSVSRQTKGCGAGAEGRTAEHR